MRNSPEWCALTGNCSGWGCRLLTIIPDPMPISVNERAKLFSLVYRTAERLGVLECPNFREKDLDSIVEDDGKLRSMRSLVHDLNI